MNDTSTSELITMYHELRADILALINDQHPFAAQNHNTEVDSLSALARRIYNELHERGAYRI